MRTVDWFLRAEAVAIFLVGVGAYLQLNGNPWLLLPLLLAPDLSMLGYLGGRGPEPSPTTSATTSSPRSCF